MTAATRGILLSLAGCAGAACFLVSYKLAAGLGDTTDATLVMLVSAAVLNTSTSVVQDRSAGVARFDRLSWWLAIVLAVLTLIGNELAVEAVRRISAPLTSVLQQTQVLFVALLGRFVLGEHVTLRFWVGTLVAALGLFLISDVRGAGVELDHGGMLLAAASAVCWATMAVCTRKYIHRIRPVPVNALRLWISIVFWFVVHARLPHWPMRPDFMTYCVVAGAFGPYLSRTALMHALRYASPTETTLIGLATPVITMLPAFLVFGTLPTLRELAGSLIMIAGISLPVLEHWQRVPLPPQRG
jgi:drug/metabolite transporter (DMT)-like permease